MHMHMRMQTCTCTCGMQVHVHIAPESEQLLDERVLHLVDAPALCLPWLQPAHLAVVAVGKAPRAHTAPTATMTMTPATTTGRASSELARSRCSANAAACRTASTSRRCVAAIESKLRPSC